MPRTRPAYLPEFRRQMVDLVGDGRSPEDLAKELQTSSHSIRGWVRAAEQAGGHRIEDGTAVPAPERDELLIRCTNRYR